MIPAGYMLKNVVPRPDWIKADCVVDIYSLSGCVSDDFCDYIKFFRHNGYWLFDSQDVLFELAKTENIDISNSTLFYYEFFEKQFDDETKTWHSFDSDSHFVTAIVEPLNRRLIGYDVVTYSCRNSAECSPLSCNMLAAELPVNEHCLFDSLEQSQEFLRSGKFTNSEPGPFRIVAVYCVNKAS